MCDRRDSESQGLEKESTGAGDKIIPVEGKPRKQGRRVRR